jgi:hypothetical protein
MAYDAALACSVLDGFQLNAPAPKLVDVFADWINRERVPDGHCFQLLDRGTSSECLSASSTALRASRRGKPVSSTLSIKQSS